MSNLNKVNAIKLMDAVTIAASGTATSVIADINALESKGNLAVQLILTGTGTATVEWEQTSDGNNINTATNFTQPTGGYTLTTGFTVTSGKGGDGKNIIPLSTSPCNFLRLKVTETGTSNAVVVTAILVSQ